MITRTLTPLIAILHAAAPAFAHTVDYVALEELFGEPVTTTVTGSPQRASQVPASMEIIDRDDIRRSGARDLPALLRHVAGIDVMQTSTNYADVSIRGYNQAFPPRMLVLLDGRQVYADYYGFTQWSTIPIELDAIRQIEVVRGPNSALFGFNAVAGVINIITEDSLTEIAPSSSIVVGTQDFRQISAVSGWRFAERAGLRLSASARRNDDFSTPQAPADVGSRRGNSRDLLNLESSLNITDRMMADVELTYSDAEQTERGPVYGTAFTSSDEYSAKVQVSAETRHGYLEGTIYRNYTASDVVKGLSSTPYLTFDADVAVARLQHLSKIGAEHTLRLSAEYRESSMATSPFEGARVHYDASALSAMWEWRLTDNLALTNAVRFDILELARAGAVPPGFPLVNDDWDRALSEASVNSGLVWRLGDLDTLRFMIGRGVQLPSLFNLGGFLIPSPADPLPGNVFVTGVPWLEPAIVTSYEVAWERGLPSLDATLRVAAFAGETRDVVAGLGGQNLPFPIVSAPANIGSSAVSGAEIEIKSEAESGWRWSASYTPIGISDRFAPGFVVESTLVDFENTMPRHVLNGSIGWSRGPWEVDAFVRYQSRFDGVQSVMEVVGSTERVSGYMTLDARLGYRFSDRLSVSVAGQGLAHDTQRQTSGVDVERRIFGSVELSF